MYPDQFLRGIPNKDFIIIIDERELPAAHLFHFNKSNEEDQKRDDGNNELSINWYDDEGALEHLLSQKKEDGNYQFLFGAAVLVRQDIDKLKRKAIALGKLAYERQPIENNKYHGNLLLKDNLPPSAMKLIAANIAVSCFLEIKKRG